MMKTAFVLSVFLTSIFVTIPMQSNSESTDYVLTGTGYGILKNGVHDVAFELTIKNHDGKLVLQNGNVLVERTRYSISDLSMSLPRNGQTIEINAMADDITIRINGKRVASTDDGSIYQLNGHIIDKNNSERLVLHAMLAPEDTPQTTSADKQEVLLLVEHYNRVEWKSQYKFTVKTYDPKLNPMSNFYMTSGSVEGVNIRATITDPLGNIIKISEGITKKPGYYEDTLIIPDNARTGIYILNVTASGEKFNMTTKELTFLVIPLLPPPTATP